MIKGVPIELGGVRSFLLYPNPDINTPSLDLSPITILVEVAFEGISKEVTISSSMTFINNTAMDITIATDSSEYDYKDTLIEPNQGFDVPLSWFIKNKSIYTKVGTQYKKLYK